MDDEPVALTGSSCNLSEDERARRNRQLANWWNQLSGNAKGFAKFLCNFQTGEEFFYRDQLRRHIVARDRRSLTIYIEDLASFDQQLAVHLRARPAVVSLCCPKSLVQPNSFQ
jgi:hypothetical protein